MKDTERLKQLIEWNRDGNFDYEKERKEKHCKKKLTKKYKY